MRRLALAAGLATARVASGPAKAVAQAVQRRSPVARRPRGPDDRAVEKALTEVTAGRPVAEPTSQPYGCSVKYAN